MPPYRPLQDRVQLVEIEHARIQREQRRQAEDVKRSAAQAEGAVEDVRTLTEAVRIITGAVADVKGIALANTGQIGEVIAVMGQMADALDRLEPTVEEARGKASGAQHRAVALEARQSKTEEQMAKAFAEAKADTDRRIALALEHPPQGDELKDLRREFVKAAKPQMPRVVQALVAFIVVALGVAGIFLTRKCGG